MNKADKKVKEQKKYSVSKLIIYFVCVCVWGEKCIMLRQLGGHFVDNRGVEISGTN